MSFLENKFGLNGKTAVITGGGGTLCSAMAEAYVKAGANVVLWDIRPDALAEKVDAIAKSTGAPDRITSVEVDLMTESSIAAAIKESAKKYGQIDILLNGAGGNRGKSPFVDIKEDEFDFVFKLNLLAGCVLPTKHIAKYWIDKKIKGVIINMASMAGFNPLSGVWAYSAAKAGVMNQTMACAKEFAPYGIRVNAMAPGFFIADQNRRLLLNEDESPTQRGKDVLAHTPMDRFGVPDDLLAAAVFLAADGAAFVSGITLPIDGAYLCDNI